MNNKSSFLFAMPSFIRGAAKVLDLGATNSSIYNESSSEEDADRRAMSADWMVVGDDLRKATNEFKNKEKKYAV